jgi:hypothetical protein
MFTSMVSRVNYFFTCGTIFINKGYVTSCRDSGVSSLLDWNYQFKNFRYSDKLYVNWGMGLCIGPTWDWGMFVCIGQVWNSLEEV